MKGRKPTPTNIRLLQGNPQHRPIGEAEPQPTAINLRVPREIRRNKVAARVWREYVPLLMKQGLATEIDKPLLIGICMELAICYRAWDRLEALHAAGQDDVYETAGRNGTMHRVRPEVNIIGEKLRTLRSLGSEFGMSPVARVRLKGVAQLDMFDRFDAFMKEMRARAA